MKHLNVRNRQTAGRFARWALLLGGVAAFSGNAMAVTLSCPTPTSTGVTATLDTGTNWELQAPGTSTWSGAATASNGSWRGDAGTWIGDGGASGAAVNGNWTYRVAVVASDPSIDLASASITYRYRSDNATLSADLNGTALPVTTAAYNDASPGLGGPVTVPLAAGNNYLSVVSRNDGGPYGLAMQATLTFNCQPVARQSAAAVPMDAPWALIGLGGLLAAGAAAATRRRRRG